MDGVDDADAEEPWRQARLHLSRRYMIRSMRQERDQATVIGGYMRRSVPDDGGGFCGGVPASKKAMVDLRVPAVGETREKDCAVCLEDFKGGEKLRMMPCSHAFHQRCIFDWLLISRLCPICRFAMESDCDQARNGSNG
ncbi:hypothetical protein ACP70R_021899 [Stipagrostis hirtigluma subsp. patula]